MTVLAFSRISFQYTRSFSVRNRYSHKNRKKQNFTDCFLRPHRRRPWFARRHRPGQKRPHAAAGCEKVRIKWEKCDYLIDKAAICCIVKETKRNAENKTFTHAPGRRRPKSLTPAPFTTRSRGFPGTARRYGSADPAPFFTIVAIQITLRERCRPSPHGIG